MNRPHATDVRALLATINSEHATRWTLVGKLAGGYQQGAYQLTDGAGARAVLKWHSGHLPPKQLKDTARAIEDARARGWPTSKWLAYGPLPNDGGYIVEEVIVGERPNRLNGRGLERLLDAGRPPAGARPGADPDWAGHIQRRGFAGRGGFPTRVVG